MVHMLGFNPEEAIRCFRKALHHDPNCAIAHFFIAHCYAPNYNDAEGLDCAAGYEEARKAVDLMSSTQRNILADWERALIHAEISRSCWPAAEPATASKHVEVMRDVYQKFGKENSLVAALFAESLSMLAPWKLWTHPPNIRAAIPETEELVAVLEQALERDPTHPGLCHFYIHAMELSVTPEKALPAANILRSRIPDQGHLLHMPSHIDMWLGQYKEAVDSNKRAVAADEKYARVMGHNNEVYKMYRLHHYHFTVWAAMFDGQFSTAMEYAEAACLLVDTEAICFTKKGFPFGSMFFESYGSLPWHVLVRFGKWEEILTRPLKEDKDLYAATTAVAYYARGIACAVLGRLKEADMECTHFRNQLKNKRLQKVYMHNNLMHDPKDHHGILDVAEAVLDGEVEYHKGNMMGAFEHLWLAVQRDISLEYVEPWGWMTPARHVLGALLLEQGQLQEAESVYREDLKQYKDNMWSLLGLYQALTRQNRLKEAASTLVMFQRASERSDIKIGASCLCATKICCQ